jgi:hypothetical protein
MVLTKKIYVFGLFLVSLLFSVVILHQSGAPPSLPINRELKRDKEIAEILKKALTLKLCVQYALVAAEDGYYPCYNGETTTIYLKRGEVWKYGKTCNGEIGRYPTGLPAPNLSFRVQLVGTEEQCLIMEKEKIYNYYLLPENIERAARTGTQPLMRPPGNKIDR